MITKDGLKDVNERIVKIPFKDKPYATVASRVKAFRELCPDGLITTDILSCENGVVTMKATVSDETGKVIATGLAQEKEDAGFVNKTSYIENCETSAIGRAMAMIGIGSDESMASAEELANALRQQETKTEKPTKAELNTIQKLCEKKGKSYKGWLEQFVPADEAGKMLNYLKDLPDKEQG